jgi:hypothetical protein
LAKLTGQKRDAGGPLCRRQASQAGRQMCGLLLARACIGYAAGDFDEVGEVHGGHFTLIKACFAAVCSLLRFNRPAQR